jgi:hypothetical protein
LNYPFREEQVWVRLLRVLSIEKQAPHRAEVSPISAKTKLAGDCDPSAWNDKNKRACPARLKVGTFHAREHHLAQASD